MPRVKKFNESDVLTEAMNLFWKQGYSATSIQDLVKFLGINRASLYDTYGGKEELFLRAFEQYRTSNTNWTKDFLNGYPNVKEGLQQLFEKALETSCSDRDRKGCFVVNTITEMVPGDDALLRILQENKVTFESVFYDYLLRGEEEGQYKAGKDLKAIASLLFTLYSGLKVVTKVEQDKRRLKQSLDVAISVLDN